MTGPRLGIPTLGRIVSNTSHRLSAVKAYAAMANARTPNLPDCSALVGGSQAACPADAGAAPGGAQPRTIAIEDDDTMAASTPLRKGASLARSAGAITRTRSREERERRRRAMPALADIDASCSSAASLDSTAQASCPRGTWAGGTECDIGRRPPRRTSCSDAVDGAPRSLVGTWNAQCRVRSWFGARKHAG